MGLLLWIVFGALIGFIADYFDSSVHLTWLERMVVGIVGAVIGGTLASILTTGQLDLAASRGFDLLSIIVAVLGSFITLFVWKRMFRRSTV